MREFDTVLFDLGGVLTTDPWESVLLTSGSGLADRLGLEKETVKRVGEELWEKYCARISNEADYWDEFASRLGVEVPLALTATLEDKLLVANPVARAAIPRLVSKGASVGLVSETTSFWYPRQIELLGLDGVLRPELKFLSFRYGVRKDVDRDGLFDVAARDVNPLRALVIDDRPLNVQRARDRGFEAIEYSMDVEPDLLDAIVERVA